MVEGGENFKMFPDYRDFSDITMISHSAKGSTWEKHKYLKVINGDYYYPDSYKGGRHLSKFEKKARKYFENREKEPEYGIGKLNETKVTKDGTLKGKKKKKMSKKKVTKLANDVISGKYGVGQQRMDQLGKKYNRVQNKVNKILLGPVAAKRIRERKRAEGLLGKKR